MARYYFHIHRNGQFSKDDEGSDLDSLDQVRDEAMAVLPATARDDVPEDGDRVMVTDEAGKPVYSATLTFAGLSLN